MISLYRDQTKFNFLIYSREIPERLTKRTITFQVFTTTHMWHESAQTKYVEEIRIPSKAHDYLARNHEAHRGNKGSSNETLSIIIPSSTFNYSGSWGYLFKMADKGLLQGVNVMKQFKFSSMIEDHAAAGCQKDRERKIFSRTN